MLILKELQLRNFLSHEETDIVFEENKKCLIDGQSGSGKSTLVESIIWALYGKGRVDNRFLVKNGEKEGSVQILLTDGEKIFRILRSVTAKGKQTLAVDFSLDGEEFEPIQITGIREMQEWIETKLVHASYTLFINSVAYPQDNVENFVKQSSAKRKELLLEIAGANNYDALHAKALSLLSLKEEAVARISGRILDKKSIIEANKDAPTSKRLLESSLASAKNDESKIKAIIDDLADKRIKSTNMRSELADIEAQCIGLKGFITMQENAITEKKKAIEALTKLDLEGLKVKQLEKILLQQELDELKKVYELDAKWLNSMSSIKASLPDSFDHETALEELEAKLQELIKNTDTKCPAVQGTDCPKLVDQLSAQAKYFQDRIEMHRKEKIKQDKAREEYVVKLEALGKRPEVNEKRIKELQGLLASYDKIDEQVRSAENAQNEIKVIEAPIEEIQKTSLQSKEILLEKTLRKQALLTELAKFEAENVDKEYQDKKAELEEVQELILMFSKEIAAQDAIIKASEEAEAGIKELEAEQTTLEAEIKALKAVKEAFGSKGIKTVVIDFFVPRLETKVNEILEKLSDFRVEIDTQKESASADNVLEGLFINIINPQGERMDFNSYSGGEKLKIVVAISEALASLQNIGFRILDEVFVGLDEEAVEGFASVLEQVQSQFKQLFVISHLGSIKQLFDDRIEVIKQNGNSLILT